MVRWIHAAQYVRVTASGPVTALEQFAAVRAAAEPHSREGLRILFDARDMTDDAETPADGELRDYARRIGALGYRRFAIVVGSPRVDVSLRFAACCAESGIEARVFPELSLARHWLVGDVPKSPDAA